MATLTWICLAFAVAVFIEFLLFLRFQNSAVIRSSSEFCECRSVPNTSYRLIRGSEVPADHLRWVASIYTTRVDEYSKDRFHQHICSATLITDKYLLTSTYCENHPTIRELKLKPFAALGGTDRSLTKMYVSATNNRMIEEYLVPDGASVPIKPTRQVGGHFTKHKIAIARLEKPFDLGSKTNIYPACLFEGSVNEFSNFLLAASYGDTVKEAPDTQQRIQADGVSHVFTGRTTLSMTYMRQTKNCSMIVRNLNESTEICVSGQGGGLTNRDLGSGLLYEHLPGRLHVVAVSIAENPENMAVFQLIYPHLKWIDSIVGSNRCKISRSSKFSIIKFLIFLGAVFFTGVVALAALYFIDIDTFQKLFGELASKGDQNAIEPSEAKRTQSNEAKRTKSNEAKKTKSNEAKKTKSNEAKKTKSNETNPTEPNRTAAQ